MPPVEFKLYCKLYIMIFIVIKQIVCQATFYAKFVFTSDIRPRMKKYACICLLWLPVTCLASDTLYFKLSNPWNTVKSPGGKYLRKAVSENEYWHTFDYNDQNMLIAESFYSDTNFTTKLFCHKYFNETKGYLEKTRCYENGRLHGFMVSYNANGDTISYQILEQGTLVKSWSLKPNENSALFDDKPKVPAFPGGTDQWISFLQENLFVPKKYKHIKGRITVKVTIGPAGDIASVEIIQGLHPELDAIVIELIKGSPKWTPAVQSGKNVPYSFPQTFNF
jgi:hypothetical protein